MKSLVLSSVFALGLLAGCNSGGSSTTSKTTAEAKPSAPDKELPSYTVTGTVASGAFAPNVKVSVFNQKKVKCGETYTDANGSYSITVACEAPLLLVAEAESSEGDAYYSFVPGKGNGQFRSNITPITSVLAALAIGDHPKSALGTASSRMEKAFDPANVQLAMSQLRKLLAPALQAFSAQSDDLLSGVLVQGKGQDSVMDAGQTLIDVDTESNRLSVHYSLPSSIKPIIMRQKLADSPDKAAFDDAFGITPDAVGSSQVAESVNAYREIQAYLLSVTANGAFSTSLGNCFLHDAKNAQQFSSSAQLSRVVGLDHLVLRRFNTFTDFADEDNEVPTNSKAPLAYVSFDLIYDDKSRSKIFTWMSNGNTNVGGCQTYSNSWAILGNQHKLVVDPQTYALAKSEYGHALSDLKYEVGTGLEFFVFDNPSEPISHVLISGPALPSDGKLFINKEGYFLKAKFSLLDLRTAKPDAVMKMIDQQVEDTRSVLLTDESMSPTTKSSLAGIVDRPYDPHNVYTFRLYRNYSDLTPALIYKGTLPKRPYLNTELPPKRFPILAVDRDHVLDAVVNFNPINMGWDLPNDLRGVPYQASKVWLSRFATNEVEECSPPTSPTAKPSCKKVKKPIKDFVLAGSSNTLAATQLSATIQGGPSVGIVDKGYAHLRVLDSFARPLYVQVGVDLTR